MTSQVAVDVHDVVTMTILLIDDCACAWTEIWSMLRESKWRVRFWVGLCVFWVDPLSIYLCCWADESGLGNHDGEVVKLLVVLDNHSYMTSIRFLQFFSCFCWFLQYKFRTTSSILTSHLMNSHVPSYQGVVSYAFFAVAASSSRCSVKAHYLSMSLSFLPPNWTVRTPLLQ